MFPSVRERKARRTAGTPPRKMHFGTSALPELIVKYAPAAAVFVFSALTSGAPVCARYISVRDCGALRRGGERVFHSLACGRASREPERKRRRAHRALRVRGKRRPMRARSPRAKTRKAAGRRGEGTARQGKGRLSLGACRLRTLLRKRNGEVRALRGCRSGTRNAVPSVHGERVPRRGGNGSFGGGSARFCAPDIRGFSGRRKAVCASARSRLRWRSRFRGHSGR